MDKQIPTAQSATRVVRGNIDKILPISVDYQTVAHSTPSTSDVVDNDPPDGSTASCTNRDCGDNVVKVHEYTHSEYTAYNDERKRITHVILPFIGVQETGSISVYTTLPCKIEKSRRDRQNRRRRPSIEPPTETRTYDNSESPI